MKNITGVTIPKDISNQFSFASTKDAFTKIAAFIGGMFFLMLMVAIVWMFLEMISPPEIKVVDSGYTEPTREELRNSMKHHGILFSREDENHEWYFMRDGKRCRLFAYLTSRGNQ